MATFATPKLEHEWVEVLDGANYASALIQIRGGRAAHICVGDNAPAEAAENYVTISNAVYPGIAFGLRESEKMWARAATSLPAVLEGDRTAR